MWKTFELSPRQAQVFLLLVLALAGACSVFVSYAKPLWFDETATAILSRLSGPGEVWQALLNAADTNPPLYYVFTKAGRQLTGNDYTGYRLPSVVGLLLIISGLYTILLRWVDRTPALVGSCFVLCTPLATHFAFEARPYSLKLGILTWAIVCWQRAGQSRLYQLLLAASLALAVSVHYYSLFAWPAFAAAEAWIWYTSRRLRTGIWLALIAGAAPMLFYASHLAGVKRRYGQNFWSKPDLTVLYSAPGDLFEVADTSWGWAFIVIPVAVLLYRVYKGEEENTRLRAADCVLIVFLLLVPLVSVVAAKVSGGGMTARYMQPTVLGAALAAGYLASKAPRQFHALLIVALIGNYLFTMKAEVGRARRGGNGQQRTISRLENALKSTRGMNLPVVFSGLEYLNTMYALQGSRGPEFDLHAIVDPQKALEYIKSDSVDLALPALTPYFPLTVEPYPAFAAKHPEFILLSTPDRNGSWWPRRLADDGHTVMFLSAEDGVQTFKVELRK